MRRKGVMRGDVQDRCEELQDSSPLTSTILGSSEGGGGVRGVARRTLFQVKSKSLTPMIVNGVLGVALAKPPSPGVILLA